MTALDPVMAQILRDSGATPAPDLLAMPIEAARAAYEARWKPWNADRGGDDPAESVTTLDAGDRTIRARIFRPRTAGDLVVVYLHGGGWMFGSPESHAALTRHLARAAGATVVSLDYRRSPEHPWPAAIDDTLVALRALLQGGVPGVAARRLALAGDSAGAAIALSAAQGHVAAGDAGLAGLALFYGCFQPGFDTDSYARFGDGAFGLSQARMAHFWRAYAGGGDTGRTAPGLGDLRGLPPVYLNAAALDVLRDDSVQLAAGLAQAGVAVRLDVAAGVVHGYAQMVGRLPAAARALDDAGAWLARTPLQQP